MNYADDTTLFCPMLQYNKHDSIIINQNLERSQWLDTNRLVLNTKKTKFILFHNLHTTKIKTKAAENSIKHFCQK